MRGEGTGGRFLCLRLVIELGGFVLDMGGWGGAVREVVEREGEVALSMLGLAK